MSKRKDIVGYEGKYCIDTMGRIWSYKYSKYMKPRIHVNYSGYKSLYITLRKNNTEKNFIISRLVAETFLPNPNNYSIVNHKDENPFNNNVNNLEWCDVKYNANYGTRNQRIAKNKSKLVKCVETGEIDTAKNFEERLGLRRYSITSVTSKYSSNKTSGGYHWEILPNAGKANICPEV